MTIVESYNYIEFMNLEKGKALYKFTFQKIEMVIFYESSCFLM